MVTNIGTQTIETERLILRRFEYSDGALALGIFYPVQSQSTMRNLKYGTLKDRIRNCLMESGRYLRLNLVYLCVRIPLHVLLHFCCKLGFAKMKKPQK